MKKYLQHVYKYKNGGKLLDIGCAYGYFLEIAGKHFDVFGIDVSDYAIKIAGVFFEKDFIVKSLNTSYKLSQQLGLKTFPHSHNLGYGGNQKTCYWEALKEKPDIIIMLHPDMQYDGTLIPNL